MYLLRFLANVAGFFVFLRISRDFADLLEIRGSETARNIRSLGYKIEQCNIQGTAFLTPISVAHTVFSSFLPTIVHPRATRLYYPHFLFLIVLLALTKLRSANTGTSH